LTDFHVKPKVGFGACAKTLKPMKLPEVIEELRALNEPVAVPARLPTEPEVDAAEERLGVHFHPDYRYFLLNAGDVTYGTVEPALVTPGAGALDLVDMANRAWVNGVPEELLPFCESNGDYYCMEEDGGVVYWSHDSASEESWPNLAEWIRDVWIEEETGGDDDEE
jgi:hypothetical protein